MSLCGLPMANAQDAKTDASKAPPPAVIVEPVAEQVLNYDDSFVGRVDAVDHIDLRARVEGYIEAVNFDEGQRVKAGDVLFNIEPDAYQAAVDQINGQIASAQAQKKLADIEVDRQTELFKRQTASESKVQEAQANQGDIVGQIQQLQAALAQAELNLSYTEVSAPFDGRVGLTDISMGAFVGPSTGALASLSSIDPIYVTFPVPEATLIEVRKRHAETGPSGVSATLKLANGDSYDQTGTIRVVDTVVQQGTDTVQIRAEFANPDGHLIDGQLVTVELVEGDETPSLTVPVRALQRDSDGAFVLTVDDSNTVAKTPVTVARTQGSIAVISQGLSKGQLVITDGQQKARPGITVDPQQAQAAPSASGSDTTATTSAGD